MKVTTICSVILLFIVFVLLFLSCNWHKTNTKNLSISAESCQLKSDTSITISHNEGVFTAYKTKSPVNIDGCNTDLIWKSLNWYDMNYIWMGEAVDSTDYYGRFKLAWDSQNLYILVEVMDNYLNPTLAYGMENYWKGDYIEVFIDEDKSGGKHHYNHQAFAYHVSTEGHAIDLNLSKEATFFDDHINVRRTQEGKRHIWEMAIKLFNDKFDEDSTYNKPITIVNNKRIGFSIAYGDNDGNESRENFMGSKSTHGINNDEGYINADVFGSILFSEIGE